MSYLEYIEEQLQDWQNKSIRRRLRFDATLLDFSSNDYLCLNRDGSHTQMLQSLAAEFSYDTVGSTGSRLIRGHWPSFEEAETQFCEWQDLPAALLFQSGYSANVGALSAISGPGDVAFCDRLCHASLLDGIRLSGAQRHYFHHNDLDHLESLLKKKGTRKSRWVLSEGVFSMDGDCPDVRGILDLCHKYDATLYLDEAHALGYLGSRRSPGGGLVAALREQASISSQELHDRIILSFPMGKAPGIMGGFVAGGKALREFLINRARSFVFSTAQPPILAAMIARIVRNFQEGAYDDRMLHLRSNAEFLRSKMESLGRQSTSQSAIVPFLIGDARDALEMSKHLETNGFDVRAIRPPTVAEGSSRLRITVHSCHSTESIARLLATVLDADLHSRN
ncbi:MAG: 8-amino-7-oxononanoate synthase [Leptospiraceae bacterium]|nr:8-amino-7-oxononanoate synthase [Leptospiraceae bacterium]